MPFLDQHLVEAVCAMPPELKLGDGGKYSLKKIARRYLPAEVVDRKKGYFPVPALKYVQGMFYEMMCDTLNSNACRERQLFQGSYITHLLNSKEDQLTPIRGNKLWHCALLEMWLQMHVRSTKYHADEGDRIMRPLYTAQQSRNADQMLIAQTPLAGYELMQRAGRACFKPFNQTLAASTQYRRLRWNRK